MIPNYVIQALAEVREEGSINMLDRKGVEALVSSERAAEWLSKASNSQYMDALNEMGRANSEDFLEDDDWLPTTGDEMDDAYPME